MLLRCVLCVCACTHTHKCARTYVGVSAHVACVRGQRATSGVILWPSSTVCLRQGLSLTWAFVKRPDCLDSTFQGSSRLSGQHILGSPCFCLSSHAQIFVWGSNPVPLAYEAKLKNWVVSLDRAQAFEEVHSY